jgi:hypothetical protein
MSAINIGTTEISSACFAVMCERVFGFTVFACTAITASDVWILIKLEFKNLINKYKKRK